MLPYALGVLFFFISKANWVRLKSHLIDTWSKESATEYISSKKAISLFLSEDNSDANKSITLQAAALVELIQFIGYKFSLKAVEFESAASTRVLLTGNPEVPVVVVAAHFVGIEFIFLSLSKLRTGALLVSPPDANTRLNTWCLLRQRLGKKVIRADHAMTEGLQLLRKGGALGFLVSAPQPPHKAKVESSGSSVASPYSTIDILQARYLAGAARTAQVLTRRTGARILWATSRQVEPGRYVGQLQEVQLQDLGESEESAQMYFAGLIKAHLQEHGLHQMAWAALGPPPEIPASFHF